MSSFKHGVRYAFKDALRASDIEGADTLRLSAINVSCTGRDHDVQVSLHGASIDGHVHLYENGGYAAVIVSVHTLDGVTWPYAWHYGWLH